MHIAIAQINCTVGDLSGNARKIVDYADRAKAGGADLLLTPELSLCGYPPEDLLLREDFCAACERALADLASKVRDISVIVGHPHRMDGKRYNAASVLQDGRIIAIYHKQRSAQLHGVRRGALFRVRRQGLRRATSTVCASG